MVAGFALDHLLVGQRSGTNSHIYVADVATLATKNLTTGLRMEPGNVTWQRADEALVQLTLGGRNALYRHQLEDAAIARRSRRPPAAGRIRVRTARSQVAYVGTSVDSPTELYSRADRRDTASGSSRSSTTSLNNEVAWSPGERFTYKSVGDLEIEGWLMKPYGYEPARSIRSCSTSTAVRTRRTAKAGSTNSRTSPAPACACCSRIRAARAARRRVHVREPRRLGRQGLRGSHEGGGHASPSAPTSTRRAWA